MNRTIFCLPEDRGRVDATVAANEASDRIEVVTHPWVPPGTIIMTSPSVMFGDFDPQCLSPTTCDLHAEWLDGLLGDEPGKDAMRWSPGDVVL